MKSFIFIKKYAALITEFRRTITEISTVTMSSIDRHIFFNHIYNSRGHFHTHYKEWTMRRINKILEIFEVEWFKNKKIIVLGDGLGNVGSFFAELGSKVLSLEGRKTNVNLGKLKYSKQKNFEIKEFDLNNDFSHFGKYDLILNLGFLDVIHNPKKVLECCCKMSNNIIIETLVCDSDDLDYFYEVFWNSDLSDSNIKHSAIIPNIKFIEHFFKNKGYIVNRYIKDLNCQPHIYNWKAKNNNSFNNQYRAFWLFRLIKENDRKK